MKQKKFIGLFLALVMVFSMLTGCGNANNSTPSAETRQPASTETTQSNTSAGTNDENRAAAEKLLIDLTGSYQELWPVILADKYEPIWLDNCKKLVGEENAQAAYKKLASMVTGEVYGEKAVAAYADGNGVYDCAFIQGVKTFMFDGAASTIKGYDADGKELFSHTYHYIGMEDTRGLYVYESNDANSGEFTYFCLAPDTSDTTYHIEFRYGSDLEALGKYDSGAYAYWLASGISTEYDQTMVEKCIELFCTENLSK